MRRAEIEWVRQVAADIQAGNVWLTHEEMKAVADTVHKRQGTDSRRDDSN